jgi:hypothetical protein
MAFQTMSCHRLKARPATSSRACSMRFCHGVTGDFIDRHAAILAVTTDSPVPIRRSPAESHRIPCRSIRTAYLFAPLCVLL